jgi:hypothetical protein
MICDAILCSETKDFNISFSSQSHSCADVFVGTIRVDWCGFQDECLFDSLAEVVFQSLEAGWLELFAGDIG